MPLLFHWVKNNYYADRLKGFEYHLNQNSNTMLRGKPGESIWAFTRRHDGTYVMAAHGKILRLSHNQPDYDYGRYRVWMDSQTTVYFDVDRGPNAEPVLRSLSFDVRTSILGQSFQGPGGVRLITDADDQKLLAFSANLEHLALRPRESIL